jgi:hypothetical protein
LGLSQHGGAFGEEEENKWVMMDDVERQESALIYGVAKMSKPDIKSTSNLARP